MICQKLSEKGKLWLQARCRKASSPCHQKWSSKLYLDNALLLEQQMEQKIMAM